MKAIEPYITGVGQSEVGVRLPQHPLQLTRDAFQEALDEAGLTRDQIDGVATYPGRAASYLGFSPHGAEEVIDAFGLQTRWHLGGGELSSQLGAVAAAADAVRAGHARHVMCFRTVYEAGAMANPEEYPPMRRKTVDGYSQWFLPFNAFSAANWVAQYASRHVQTYGLTREQLGQIPINDYANAMKNPRAIARAPITLDDYMSVRMISSPLCLYDCDRYTDAATVIIVSAGDALDEVSCTPVRIAASAASVERHSWDQADWVAAYPTGKELWNHTDYKPEDVDTAQLYDGFSFLTLTWLEGLGFCDIGEAGRFIEGGQRIALNGELPLNTGGGQIGAGRLHGFGFAHEAVVQLRGKGGERQIPGNPQVAVATSGGGPLATALLLARD